MITVAGISGVARKAGRLTAKGAKASAKALKHVAKTTTKAGAEMKELAKETVRETKIATRELRKGYEQEMDKK